MQEKRLQEAALEAAQTAFMNDSKVQHWLAHLDGKVDLKSITPLTPSN
jgi:hypothetical protein